NYRNAFPVLGKYNLTAPFFIVTSFVGLTNKWDELLGEIRSNILSWDEIIMMSRAGMSFGSHSCTHRRLTACPDELLERELRESKTMLEERLNKRIELFSYPWGDSDLRTTQIVKNAGYIAACSDRKCETEKLFLYNLNRIRIYPRDSLTLFRIKVSGWYDWLENLLTILKIRGIMRRVKTLEAQGDFFV
ncbi:MAG: polysaccharide deacetylase family protein, partial [Candidatus Hodarchaeota archaeon]